jgi:hypothetical protein
VHPQTPKIQPIPAPFAVAARGEPKLALAQHKTLACARSSEVGGRA